MWSKPTILQNSDETKPGQTRFSISAFFNQNLNYLPKSLDLLLIKQAKVKPFFYKVKSWVTWHVTDEMQS